MSKPGHNSGKGGPVNADRLKSFVERIEKLEEERKAIGGDIKDVYSEAKGVGYDVGTMRKVVRLRAMDAADRAEQETLLDVYWHALQTVDRIDERLAAGESQREVAAAEGVSKSTVQRRGPKVESAPASSKMDHPKPETGDDGITESCGGGESRPVSGLSPEPNESVGLQGGDPAGAATSPHATEAGVAPGPHDTSALEPDERRNTVALERRQSEADEAPATPSVGAVASESERVAHSDEMPEIPAFLRRPQTQEAGA